MGGEFKAKFSELKQVGGWKVVGFLGEGGYGSVFKVHGPDEPMYRALKLSNDRDGNTSLEWEALILRLLQEKKRGDNFVKLYDQGTHTHTSKDKKSKKEKLSYMVMTLVDCNAIEKRIFGALKNKRPRPDLCMQEALMVSMQILKALYDLHSVGVLHRDLKPENLGAMPKPNDRVVALYDLGLARVYTDEKGALLPPRTYVGMRGTRHWASANAEKGREQGRVDDLWSWFYSLVEWMQRSYLYDKTVICLPWDYRGRRHRDLLKSPQMPAHVFLRGSMSPPQMYRINAHLSLLRRDDLPDYGLLGRALVDAHKEIGRNSKWCPGPPEFMPGLQSLPQETTEETDNDDDEAATEANEEQKRQKRKKIRQVAEDPTQFDDDDDFYGVE